MPIGLDDFKYIAKLVLDRSAIVLDENKDYLVSTKMNKLIKQQGLESITVLVNKLKSESIRDLADKVVDEMTTNETSFFRDMSLFDSLQKNILPEIIKKRESTKSLNIWCAACASGQEPYSTAMTLDAHFPKLKDWSVKMVASDISNTILQHAKTGVYNQIEVNRGLPKALLEKYFKSNGPSWEIDEKIQRIIEFRKFNLNDSFSAINKQDIIFIRNVLYYFDDKTKEVILEKMANVLRPDGILILGSTEMTFNIKTKFERTKMGNAFVYRLNTSH